MLISKLPELDLNEKRVFLRADLNVPIKDKKIQDDFKLEASLKTIELLLLKKAKIILATHIDRPKKYDPNLSTEIVANWFKKKKFKIDFESDIDAAYKKSFSNPKNILLLENLRFYEGEKNQDKKFAKKLAQCADYYVNDAFGSIHRNDTSISVLPWEFSENNRTIGLLMEKELTCLENLTNPYHPFLVIMGGAKILDKLTIAIHLLKKVDFIYFCPAIAFNFMKANGIRVGKSLVDENAFNICREIEKKAVINNVKICLPLDFLVCRKNNPKKLEVINYDEFTQNDYGVIIGPKSVYELNELINKSQTIFFNGLPGFLDISESLLVVKKIFESMANSKAYTFIGGGDSTAAARLLNFENKINHLSTGGGAVLAFLAREKLPGLQPFMTI